MTTHFFKVIGQKTSGKLVLIAVVEQDMLGDVPEIFELQATQLPKNIYTGTYPTIKLNMSTLVDQTDELKGMGLAGIITESDWYTTNRVENDPLGISIE